MVDAIMKTQEMKPLLVKAKEEPVSAAIGMTKEGEGIILLKKLAEPRQMLGLLRQSAGKAGVKLESSTLRFGRAEIDTDEKASVVKFTVNKEGSEKLRKTLQMRVREMQFQNVLILVDESLKQDEGAPQQNESLPENGEDPQTEDPMAPYAKQLDKLEIAIRQAAGLVGNNPGSRPLVVQALKALQAGRECISKTDGPGAQKQIELATLALKQIGTSDTVKPEGWQRPQPQQPNGEQPQPTITMGRRNRHDLVPAERRRPRSDQVQHAVSRRLLTGEELMQRLDKRPKKDLLGGLFKQSTRFKEVLTALKPIDDFMNQSCENIDKGSFEQAQLQMTQAGNKARIPLDTYKKKLDNDYEVMKAKAYKLDFGTEPYKKVQQQLSKTDLKRKRLEADKEHLEEAVKSYQGDELEKSWQLIKSDPGFEKVKGKLTIGQAIQLKSCGISFADVDLDDLNDKSLDKENSKEQFGSGGINSVSRLKYQNGTEKVFKPMQDDRGGAAAAFHAGISKESPHFENRNVTSHVVGKALGTNVIPEATVGIHNGRVGLMMELAKGREPRTTAFELGKSPQPQKIPKLQQQLMDLEWCDLVSGQLDRHHKNYLVDMSSDPPKVTGIDNDLAFGPKSTSTETLEKTPGYNGCGKPKLIDRKTFQKLMELDFDKDLRPGLEGRITFSEIDATKNRVEELKKHAQSLDPDFIVDDWSAWRLKLENGEELTATQFLGQDKKSLFGRDFTEFAKL